MAISHTGHNHPATPAGRRACRATANLIPNASNSFSKPQDVDYIGDHIRKTAANGRMKARMDREYAARIQPRRSGARVSAGAASCVQTALHKGTGRCACGWHTEGF